MVITTGTDAEPSFAEVLNGISALVACLRPDGTVETVNHHVLDYFGKTLEELKEWSSTDAVHPDDLPHVLAVSKRSFETGEPYDVELRQRRADGAYRWFHVQGLPVRGADGQINRWCVLQTDVTAAKGAEERIRKDERELATAIETIPALVLSFLPDGTVDFVSHRWLDYVGHAREEMFPARKPLSPTLGGAWKSTNHPDDFDRALNKWQAALATGEPLELETRYRRADGQYRWFLVRSVPLRDEIGQIVKWYATFTDIDDRKQAEEKLRRSERELRLIFETIPAMVYTMNADGDIELVNERLLTFLGTKTLAFNEWSNFIHADDR
ncbi:MAG TPA: PAS domain-containing protein, partial [Edaphobacter sp.]|nr:PAS domain-containing protein [Edaphobacter sp.]